MSRGLQESLAGSLPQPWTEAWLEVTSEMNLIQGRLRSVQMKVSMYNIQNKQCCHNCYEKQGRNKKKNHG